MLSGWQRKAEVALARRRTRRDRRERIRRWIAEGQVDAAAQVAAAADPFGDGALWDAVDAAVERGTYAEIAALEPLARLRPEFDRALFSALRRFDPGAPDDALTALRDLGADDRFPPFKRMCARAWATFLEMPRFDPGGAPAAPPPPVLQFWDSETVPSDVAALIEDCRQTTSPYHTLLHEAGARRFLREAYGTGATEVFDLCPHAAVKADYLRLGWLATHGGVWIDADTRLLPDFRGTWPAMAGQTVLWFNTLTGHWLNGFLAVPAGSPLMVACFERATRQIRRNPDRHPYALAGAGVLTRTINEMWRAGTLTDAANLTTRAIGRLMRQVDAAYKKAGATWQRQRDGREAGE